MGTGTARLSALITEHEIREVVYRYCRGIDRCDYDLVRSCYHPDAIDDHGGFRGGIDDFVAYCQDGLPRFQRTMHFIGNVLIDVGGDHARAESYTVAYSRIRASATKPERDLVLGLRYVDDFERRNDEWRIAARLCVYDWDRIDNVVPGAWTMFEGATLGQRDRSDAVYAPSIADRIR